MPGVGHGGVYAIGDIAYMEEPAWPNGHPSGSGCRYSANRLAGAHFRQMAKDPDARPAGGIHHRDKGAMATVGRNLAVVDVPQTQMAYPGLILADIG